jgi:hypothetical protein
MSLNHRVDPQSEILIVKLSHCKKPPQKALALRIGRRLVEKRRNFGAVVGDQMSVIRIHERQLMFQEIRSIDLNLLAVTKHGQRSIKASEKGEIGPPFRWSSELFGLRPYE